MAFERFTARGRVAGPCISIRSNGQIAFSKAAVDTFDLMNFRYAVLFFDPERKAIGIKPTNDDTEPGARRLTAKKGSAFITAQSFLGYYNIGKEKAVRYPLQKDEETGLLVAEIKDKD